MPHPQEARCEVAGFVVFDEEGVLVVVFFMTIISPTPSPDTTSVFPPLLMPITISVRMVSTFAVVVIVPPHALRDPENPFVRHDEFLAPENAHHQLPEREGRVPLPVIPDPVDIFSKFLLAHEFTIGRFAPDQNPFP